MAKRLPCINAWVYKVDRHSKIVRITVPESPIPPMHATIHRRYPDVGIDEGCIYAAQDVWFDNSGAVNKYDVRCEFLQLIGQYLPTDAVYRSCEL